MNKKIIWKPQPKQVEMLSRGEDEGFYGGAAGGGKSDYLIIEALRQVKIPHYRALILRKTVPELAQLLERANTYYLSISPKTKFNASTHTFTFPSGAKIQFGSLFRADDKYKYQGLQYDFIGFDELTQFSYEEYMYLKSRNRANGKGTRVYMRATGNPGGVGHGWVKQRFVTAGVPGQTIWTPENVKFPDGTVKRYYSSRVFIRSQIFDNQELLRNDPDYLKRLAELPEAERNALLYGSWDSFDGQVFTEFTDDPEHYKDKRFTHVIEPFKIPWGWRIIRSFDWGYTKPFSVGWFAVDNDGRYYRIREYYGCSDKPNTGIRKTVEDVAKDILQIEQNDENLKGRHIYGTADPAIFTEDGSGTSIAASMARLGVHWNKGDNSRIAGKMQYHYRLAFDCDGVPMFYVFKTCPNFIRTIPNLVYSEKYVEDIDTDGEDHIYDESRYAFMENIIPPRRNFLQRDDPFDPLNLRKKIF